MSRGWLRLALRPAKSPPFRKATITIRTSAEVRRVLSCMLDRPLDFSRQGDAVIVSLPKLEEGDVLLLE